MALLELLIGLAILGFLVRLVIMVLIGLGIAVGAGVDRAKNGKRS